MAYLTQNGKYVSSSGNLMVSSVGVFASPSPPPSVIPASVVFVNESPDLIDGTNNYITVESSGSLAGAAGNGYYINLYSNKTSVWKTTIYDATGGTVASRTTYDTLDVHIAEVNANLNNYIKMTETGEVPDNVTYSAGTGFPGAIEMTGGVG